MYLKFYKTRVIYIFLAIFCLVAFLTSSMLIIKYKGNAVKNKDPDLIQVFSYGERFSKDENLLLLKIMSTTNSSFGLLYKEKYSSNKLINVDLAKVNLKNFLKSQFPVIFSISEDNLNIPTKDNTKVKDEVSLNPEALEDLIYLEDEMEKEEGKLLEESITTSMESIPLENNIEKLIVNRDKPYVLIYHTHGTEAYLPIKENQFHISDRKYNVVSIGKIISDTLNIKGHGNIHVDTYHDVPSYGKSYARSLNTITNIMKEDENLKVVFDIHRDGIPEDAKYKDKAISQSKIILDEKNVATFSLVIGPDSPNVEKVLNFAKYIKSVSDYFYPGLCKGIIIKPTGRFNQFASDYYALIEVGSNLNTIEEAQESAKLIGEILDVVINKIQE